MGISYEIKDRIRPELRIGTDVLIENGSLELSMMYDIKDTEAFEIYAGVGGRLIILEGLLIPIGANFYPFAQRQFGFHIEVAPIFLTDDGFGTGEVIRGSWGIRYRFKKGKVNG